MHDETDWNLQWTAQRPLQQHSSNPPAAGGWPIYFLNRAVLSIDKVDNALRIDYCISVTTVKQCHTTCALDVQCAGYVYWPKGNCQLFATAPEAGYLLAQDKDSTYYQKVCLPCAFYNGMRQFSRCPTTAILATNKTTCGRSFERFAQMVLVGIAEEVLEPVSLEQCLAACTDSSFCKSVMFFHKGKHCVINSEDKTTQPHLFSPVAIDDTIVDYYERRCDGCEFSSPYDYA
jgi:hypothetical protein